MEIIRDAVNAVQKNLRTLAFYVVVIFCASVVANTANAWIGETGDDPYGEPRLVAYEVAQGLFLVFVYAFAQSVAFSRLGREIDRPLWKISGDLEAVKKFLPLWAGLNSIVYLVAVLTSWTAYTFEASAASGLLLVLMILALILYIPVGASFMFIHTSDWTRLREAVHPLLRRYPKTLVVVLFAGLLFLLQLSLISSTREQVWLWPVIDVVFAYFHCVVFSAAWLILMFDRQTPDEVDLDF